MEATQRQGRHRGWWREWLGVGLFVFVAGTWAILPERPRTHYAAVANMLHQREVRYDVLVVGELRQPRTGDCGLPACNDREAIVILGNERRTYGRIVCRDDDADCVLTLPALGFYGEPLPDLAGVRRYPRTPEDMVLVVRAWVRQAIASLFSR